MTPLPAKEEGCLSVNLRSPGEANSSRSPLASTSRRIVSSGCIVPPARFRSPPGGGTLSDFGRLQASIHHLLFVEPMFNMIALQDEPRMIELAHRVCGILGGRKHIVQRASLVAGAAPRVGIALVVQHLVF